MLKSKTAVRGTGYRVQVVDPRKLRLKSILQMGKKNILLYTIHFTLLAFLLSGCGQNNYKESRLLMGTVFDITIRASNQEIAKEAANKAFIEIQNLENKLSVFKNDSEISLLNRNGQISNPSPELTAIIKESIRAGDLSAGAFDITLAPVINLWGFGPKEKTSVRASERQSVKKTDNIEIPEEKEIKEALKLVNYKNIVIDEKNNSIYFKKKGMEINLGGIAKGYAVDKAVEVLKRENIKKAIVNAGGNLFAYGTTWRVGIKNPRKEGIFKTVCVKNKAIATSGDYERFFVSEVKGKRKRFSHIFDPRTGYPAQDCISATVIAPSGVESDWLSTSLFVLGPEKAKALLNKMGLKGIIIDKNEKIIEVN